MPVISFETSSLQIFITHQIHNEINTAIILNEITVVIIIGRQLHVKHESCSFSCPSLMTRPPPSHSLWHNHIWTMPIHFCMVFLLQVSIKSSTVSIQLPNSFCRNHAFLLFTTLWNSFTGYWSALGLTSKSPLLTCWTPSPGYPPHFCELISPYQTPHSLWPSDNLLCPLW